MYVGWSSSLHTLEAEGLTNRTIDDGGMVGRAVVEPKSSIRVGSEVHVLSGTLMMEFCLFIEGLPSFSSRSGLNPGVESRR
jgi:hypothetical protein